MRIGPSSIVRERHFASNNLRSFATSNFIDAHLDDRSIVIAARKDPDLIRQHLINEPVLLVDAPRPAAGKLMLERLRLAYSRKRFALHIPDRADDTDCLSPITFSPPHQVLEC